MHAWRVPRFGSYKEVLHWEEVAKPEPGPQQAQIRVTGAGISFGMILKIAGKYQTKDPLPFTPGLEVVGVVEQAAKGFPFPVGERVMGYVYGGLGTCAEYTILDAELTYPIPDGMPDAEAAGFLNAYQTAYMGLVDRADLRPGDWLLVHGAAGGVGTAAVQLGRALGARVIATAGSAEKLAFCRKQGAEFAFNYLEQDFAEEVNRVTKGHGADVILDPVGGDVFDKSTRCIAWDGRLTVVGFASGRIPELAINRVLLKNIAVTGLSLGSYRTAGQERVTQAMEHLLALYHEGQIRPVISHAVKLTELPRAIGLVESRISQGKVIVTP
jgi:NADPH2:quinone reductase